MVILVGGISCTGKTVMAQKLLEKYNILYLSIDHIKMGLIRGNKYCDFSATDSDDELTGISQALVADSLRHKAFGMSSFKN